MARVGQPGRLTYWKAAFTIEYHRGMGGMVETQYVVIVEDNPMEAAHMQRLVQETGCRADVARNGVDGLELVRHEPPAVVVTDLRMPEMDGLELTERLRDEFPGIPVIVITGVGSEEIAAEALHLGAASYVTKRRLATTFVPTLRRLLRRVEAEGLSREVGHFVTQTDLRMEVGNDETLVPRLVALLIEHVRSYSCCSDHELMHIGTALDEALLNAMLHGNLEVSSALRETEGGAPYRELIRQRRQQMPYAARQVSIHLEVSQQQVRFVIRDSGPGFDPTSIPDPTDPANMLNASGRGLLLINTFMDQVSHNTPGNEITMVKRPAAK